MEDIILQLENAAHGRHEGAPRDSDPEVRHLALVALSDVAEDSIIPALIEAIADHPTHLFPQLIQRVARDPRSTRLIEPILRHAAKAPLGMYTLDALHELLLAHPEAATGSVREALVAALEQVLRAANDASEPFLDGAPRFATAVRLAGLLREQRLLPWVFKGQKRRDAGEPPVYEAIRDALARYGMSGSLP